MRNYAQERLIYLRSLLQEELQSDQSGLLYIEDLQLSIARQEREVQFVSDKHYLMVN